jgi:hypothetical protein
MRSTWKPDISSSEDGWIRPGDHVLLVAEVREPACSRKLKIFLKPELRDAGDGDLESTLTEGGDNGGG